MAMTQGLRPGGRSARVQAAVHQAVKALQREAGREGLTVPAIAARAGVTPSTIYRRWGDLSQLLADVAVEQLQPEQPPPDTGSFQGDLLAWLEQYIDEMASEPGRALMRDVLCAPRHENAGKCADFTARQIEVMRERALARGEAPASAERVIEQAVAPLIYRVLFSAEPPGRDDVRRLAAVVAA